MILGSQGGGEALGGHLLLSVKQKRGLTDRSEATRVLS
jgi:hypothetical protein